MSLTDGYDLSGLTFQSAYLRYVTVGGIGDPVTTEAHLLGLVEPGTFEHDVLAQALNEHFIDLGQDHAVGYLGVTDDTGA